MPVHNHGTEDGPGLTCPERIINGERKGKCMGVIPAEAVEAAARVLHAQESQQQDVGEFSLEVYEHDVRAILEAAAPIMQQEVDLMRWKLDALKEWADAMIDESYYPQYGRDVRTLLEVKSIDEARGIDAL